MLSREMRRNRRIIELPATLHLRARSVQEKLSQGDKDRGGFAQLIRPPRKSKFPDEVGTRGDFCVHCPSFLTD